MHFCEISFFSGIRWIFFFISCVQPYIRLKMFSQKGIQFWLDIYILELKWKFKHYFTLHQYIDNQAQFTCLMCVTVRIVAIPRARETAGKGRNTRAFKFTCELDKKLSPGFQQAVVAWRQHVHVLPWASSGHCLSSHLLPSPASLQTVLGKMNNGVKIWEIKWAKLFLQLEEIEE